MLSLGNTNSYLLATIFATIATMLTTRDSELDGYVDVKCKPERNNVRIGKQGYYALDRSLVVVVLLLLLTFSFKAAASTPPDVTAMFR